MNAFTYALIAVFVVVALVVEYLERREIRRLRLYRDAARASASRGYWSDTGYENNVMDRRRRLAARSEE